MWSKIEPVHPRLSLWSTSCVGRNRRNEQGSEPTHSDWLRPKISHFSELLFPHLQNVTRNVCPPCQSQGSVCEAGHDDSVRSRTNKEASKSTRLVLCGFESFGLEKCSCMATVLLLVIHSCEMVNYMTVWLGYGAQLLGQTPFKMLLWRFSFFYLFY